MKTVPFTKEQMEKIAKIYPTPLHIYDEQAIRKHAQRFREAFSILPGFREYFAVKATPNPSILRVLKEEGFGADCSSLPELMLSEQVGITGEQIMFTSNDTPAKEYKKAKELGAIINLDDITHIEYLEKEVGLPKLVCFRFNPGPERSGNAIIGEPQEAKYGFTRAQLFEGYKMLLAKGVQHFGLHTMVCSNELNPRYFAQTATMLFELAVEIKKRLGIELEFLNLGGGIGIPYRPEQEAVDYTVLAKMIADEYERLLSAADLRPNIYLECGRAITGPFGYLVTRAIHEKHTYKEYIGCDATMANLMRPGMYGAYHHITVLGKEQQPATETYDVTGSLCENNDKFAIDRKLPKIERSDLLVIHDAGAHGHAMGFNYNGKLRSAELLLKEDGSVKLIRRAETIEDYFATLNIGDTNGKEK